jgi:hypothetical protein
MALERPVSLGLDRLYFFKNESKSGINLFWDVVVNNFFFRAVAF